MTKFQAIVFDCDGVLVNSKEIVQDIELELSAEHGLHYERAEFSRRFIGTSNASFSAALNADSQELLSKPLPTDFFDTLSERARASFEQNLIAFDGIHNLAAEWHGKLAVASSNSVEHLEANWRSAD